MNNNELMPRSSDLQSLLFDEQAAPPMPASLQTKIGARLARSIANIPTSPNACTAEQIADPGVAEQIADPGAAEQIAASAASAKVASGLSPMASLAAKPVLLAAAAFGIGLGAGVAGTNYGSKNSSLATQQPVALVQPLAVGEDASPAALPAPDPVIVIDASAAPVAVERTPKQRPAQSPQSSQTKAPVEKPGKDKSLADERSLLELSRTAITRGDAPTALEQLERHARWYRRGRLAEERDALWVHALVLNRKFARAKSKAETFENKYPKSLFLPVLDHLPKGAP